MKKILLLHEFINEGKSSKVIYHFTENIDSLDSILYCDCLESGSFNGKFGRGYDNISFTWNPNLWSIEYLGDYDSRYKACIVFDYEKMSKVYDFKPFDYGIEEEEEMIIESESINPITPFIKEILISMEVPIGDVKYIKEAYPNIKVRRVKKSKGV